MTPAMSAGFFQFFIEFQVRLELLRTSTCCWYEVGRPKVPFRKQYLASTEFNVSASIQKGLSLATSRT